MNFFQFQTPNLNNESWEFCEEEGRYLLRNPLFILNWNFLFLNLFSSQFVIFPFLLFSFMFGCPSFSMAHFYEPPSLGKMLKEPLVPSEVKKPNLYPLPSHWPVEHFYMDLNEFKKNTPPHYVYFKQEGDCVEISSEPFF
jgi:hypothetical protein